MSALQNAILFSSVCNTANVYSTASHVCSTDTQDCTTFHFAESSTASFISLAQINRDHKYPLPVDGFSQKDDTYL